MIPAIRVNEQDRDRWQAALIRAYERLLGHEQVSEWNTALETIIDCQVDSWSRPGTTHLVRIIQMGGETSTSCPCEAGSTGTICAHAALALDQARMWPDDVDVYRQIRIEAHEMTAVGASRLDSLGPDPTGRPAFSKDPVRRARQRREWQRQRERGR